MDGASLTSGVLPSCSIWACLTVRRAISAFRHDNLMTGYPHCRTGFNLPVAVCRIACWGRWIRKTGHYARAFV